MGTSLGALTLYDLGGHVIYRLTSLAKCQISVIVQSLVCVLSHLQCIHEELVFVGDVLGFLRTLDWRKGIVDKFRADNPRGSQCSNFRRNLIIAITGLAVAPSYTVRNRRIYYGTIDGRLVLSEKSMFGGTSHSELYQDAQEESAVPSSCSLHLCACFDLRLRSLLRHGWECIPRNP